MRDSDAKSEIPSGYSPGEDDKDLLMNSTLEAKSYSATSSGEYTPRVAVLVASSVPPGFSRVNSASSSVSSASTVSVTSGIVTPVGDSAWTLGLPLAGSASPGSASPGAPGSPRSSGLVHVYVMDLENREVPFKVAKNMKIGQIIERFAEFAGFSAASLDVSYNGVKVNMDETIESIRFVDFDRLLAYPPEQLVKLKSAAFHE